MLTDEWGSSESPHSKRGKAHYAIHLRISVRRPSAVCYRLFSRLREGLRLVGLGASVQARGSFSQVLPAGVLVGLVWIVPFLVLLFESCRLCDRGPRPLVRPSRGALELRSSLLPPRPSVRLL